MLLLDCSLVCWLLYMYLCKSGIICVIGISIEINRVTIFLVTFALQLMCISFFCCYATLKILTSDDSTKTETEPLFVLFLSCRRLNLWVIHVCFPSSHPLITSQELLKSASSHDINSRAFLGKPLSGKLWRDEVVQERASHSGRWMCRGTLYFCSGVPMYVCGWLCIWLSRYCV